MNNDPSTVRAAQEVIVRDVLRWALPSSTLCSLFIFISSLVTGMFPQLWSRGVPSLLMLICSLLAIWFMRRGRLVASVSTLMAGQVVVIFIVLTFNGGVRSPAAMLLLSLIAACGWVFGRRAATVMAGVCAAVLTFYFVLGLTNRLTEPPLVPLAGEYVMLLVMTELIWITSAAPQGRMRSALLQAHVREQQLREEQAARLEAAQLFRAVFEQTPYLMGLLTPDGRVESVNLGALEFVGVTADEVLGRPFPETPWWPEAERERVAQAIVRARQGPVRFETTHLDAKRLPRAIDFSLSPFRDPTGELRFLIAEGHDITEFNLARERRQNTLRLELVGQLAGGLAHDVNNVMMTIVGSTEVIRLDLASPSYDGREIQESLDAILAAGRRAGELTRRLLAFGRRGTVERRPVAMNALLDSTAKVLARTLPPNIRVVVEPRALNDLVRGDVASLESALFNLAINAREAMPQGGTLTLSSGIVELDEEWCRANGNAVKPGTYLRISVRDTGTGIAPEIVGRVFEPFFSTKDVVGPSAGLGLPAVFGVVREHSGTVQLETELGRGTVVHLSLPLSAPAPRGTAPPQLERRFPGLRVLVIDDEAPIRKMLARLLERLGMDCTLAATAEEGLASFDDRIQLVITDIVLPGRRGTELAAELMAKHPALRVLLMSGYPRESEISNLPASQVGFLAKPFNFEALQRALCELVG